MRSPALAITWQVWYRHRWALAGLLAYVVTLAFLFRVQPFGPYTPAELSTHGMLCSMLGVAWLSYAGGAFSFGSEMPLEGTASGYPSWMFTLPVRTRELVLWPMLQGMAVVALLGEVWAQGVLRPCGYEVSLGI